MELTSWPNRDTLPEEGFKRHPISIRSVVLPLPEGPIRMNSLPGSNFIDTRSTAYTADSPWP